MLCTRDTEATRSSTKCLDGDPHEFFLNNEFTSSSGPPPPPSLVYDIINEKYEPIEAPKLLQKVSHLKSWIPLVSARELELYRGFRMRNCAPPLGTGSI